MTSHSGRGAGRDSELLEHLQPVEHRGEVAGAAIVDTEHLHLTLRSAPPRPGTLASAAGRAKARARLLVTSVRR
jgi:hypothetical protein